MTVAPLAIPSKLWDHQEQAVQAAVTELTVRRRAQVVMACGTGKTRTGAEARRRLVPTGRALVVVPTLELLAQNAREWARHLGPDLGHLIAVCSDAQAMDRAAAELGDLSALVSTHPDEIAAELRTGPATVFVTYASLSVIADLWSEHRIDWDLALIDEAHRAVGRRGRSWSVINDDRRVRVQRRLYMTATPRLLASDREDDVGMEDESVFGREVHRLSFTQAVDRGLLSDYRVVVAVISNHELAELLAGHTLVDSGGHIIPASMAAAQATLVRAISEYDLRRVITYHRRVLSAKRFSGTLSALIDRLPFDHRPQRTVWAHHLTGQTNALGRRRVLQQLAQPGDGCAVVANARLLSEGVDVPELDGVMFCDPRDSQVDVIQAVGRAVRRGDSDTKVATIIIPVYLAQGENPAAHLEGSGFELVWRVLRALRAHDERLALYLDAQRAQHARRPVTEQGPHPLPDWLQVQGEVVDADFASAVHLRMVEMTTTSWPVYLQAARDFHARHGHLDVPKSAPLHGDLNLYAWVVRQRMLYHRNALPAERVSALEELDITWRKGPSRNRGLTSDQAWERGLAELRVFVEQNGHPHVPQNHISASEYRLGMWVSNQRIRWRQEGLTPDQSADLEQIGLLRDGSPWGRGLAAARTYRHHHGHLKVLKQQEWDGIRLGEWVLARRGEYHRGELAPDRVQELEALDMVWNGRPTWEDGLCAARAFAAEHGHLLPPPDTTVHGLDLPTWIGNRRKERKKGELAHDKIEALQKLGMVWDVYAQEREDALSDLREFYAQHQHLVVPGRHRGRRIKRLSVWLERRRKQARDGELDPTLAQQLHDITPHWQRGARS